MDIHERQAGAVTILELYGDLMGPACAVLAESVDRVLAEHCGRIVLDLRHVPSIDAEGVGELVALRQAVTARGAGLRVIHPAERVRQLLRLSRVDEVIDTALLGVIDGARVGPCEATRSSARR
jgi:anti-anti-sigma factor